MWPNSFLLSTAFICMSFGFGQPAHVKDGPWELLIFTQRWPVTVCKDWTNHNPTHKCAMPSKDGLWTIHGVWPTKKGTMGPAFCNNSWHFDPEAVRPIETQLTQLWTNIEADTSTYGLWAHEWNKHGTCAAVLEPLNSELKYFQNGLAWAQQYSMEDILNEANIIPSDDKEYPIFDIFNAIKSKLGVNPVIECRKEKGGKNWLFELRICFNKTLELANCDGVLKIQPKLLVMNQGKVLATILSNCDMSEGIIYPSKSVLAPPNRLYVQLYKFVTWLQWLTL